MPDITWKYVKNLSNKTAIEEFENKHGILFPPDLKECIKENNGGRPSKTIFDTDKSKERVFKTLLSFNEADIENIYKVFFAVRSENNALLPFASDPGGNFLCVLNNKIVLFLHESNSIENAADSFTEFLEKLYSF